MDLRLAKLDSFFQIYGCPEPNHAIDYVRTADSHHIDYRLLPAISFIETTCGIAQRLNNHWGWDSAKTGFKSFEAGLELVARNIANGVYYRNKSLDEKLRTYNPDPKYAVQVKRIMREISETEPIPAAVAIESTDR